MLLNCGSTLEGYWGGDNLFEVCQTNKKKNNKEREKKHNKWRKSNTTISLKYGMIWKKKEILRQEN
jgi:hypothetical protein